MSQLAVLLIRDLAVELWAATGEAIFTRSVDAPTWTLGADDLQAVIGEMPPGKGPIAIHLPPSWLYVHPVNTPIRRPNALTLASALEEYLPEPVEQYYCEFVATELHRWIGGAVRRSGLDVVTRVVQERGYSISEVRIAGPKTPKDFDGHWLWCDESSWSVFEFAGGKLNDLRVLRFDRSTALAERALALRDAIEFTGIRVAGTLGDERLHQIASVIDPVQAEVEACNGLSAIERLQIKCSAATWSRTSSRLFQRLGLGVAAALVLITVGLEIKRQNIADALLEIRAKDQMCFERLFPDEPVPRAIASRIQTERRRIEAVAPAAGKQTSMDAMEALVRVLGACPTDVRLNVKEIRSDGNGVMLRGETLSHQHAERLTQAVGRVPGIECDAPRTDRLAAGGVRFVLQAAAAEIRGQP